MKLLFARAKETYNSNKYVKVGVRVLISAALVILIAKTQDLNVIKERILRFNLIYLLISVLLGLIGTYISSMRWSLILKTSNKHVPILKLFFLYIKGYSYNNFLPTQMGGDVYKAAAVGSQINDQSVGFFSVFMDRFGGLIALLILGFFGIASLKGPMWLLFAVIALAVGFYLYFPVLKLFSKKIKFFGKFEEASNLLLKNKSNAFLIILYSFVVQFISFLGAYVLFLGLNIHLTFQDVIAYMPIASLSSLIPSFNGFGTQDTVYAFLFQNAGVTSDLSITVSVMLHAVRLILSLIGGILILLNIPKE